MDAVVRAAVIGVAVVWILVLIVGLYAAYGCSTYYWDQRCRLFPRTRYSTLKAQTRALYAARRGAGVGVDAKPATALKTGDLVFFDAAAFSVLVKWTARVPFSHVGVVVVIGGEPYIAESVDYRSHYCTRPGVAKTGEALEPQRDCYMLKGGVSVWPLEQRLRDYAGRCFVARLSAPLSPAQEEALARAAFGETQPFARPLDQLGALVGVRPRSVHCFQFASRLLNRSGVPARLLPEHALFAPVYALSDCRRLRLAGGRQYGPVTEVLFDIDAE